MTERFARIIGYSDQHSSGTNNHEYGLLEEGVPNHYRYCFWIVFFCTLLAFAYHATVPVGGDGEVWWQMAMGRDWLSQRPLPLPFVLSGWQNAETMAPEQAPWAGQALLHLIHHHFGVNGLHVLRYVLLLGTALSMFFWMRRARVLWNPISWVFPLACLLSAPALLATLKPETFSYLCFSCVLGIWLYRKRPLENRIRLEYLLPLVFALWVNLHPLWVLGAAFLMLGALGEGLNLLIRYKRVPSKSDWIHGSVVALLILIVVTFNPAGPAFALKQITEVFSGNSAYGTFWELTPLWDMESHQHRLLMWTLLLVALGITLLFLRLRHAIPRQKVIIRSYWMILIPFLVFMEMDPDRSGTLVNDISISAFFLLSFALATAAIVPLFKEKRLDLAGLLPLIACALLLLLCHRLLPIAIMGIGFALLLLIERKQEHDVFEARTLELWFSPVITLILLAMTGLSIYHNFHHKNYQWMGWGSDEFAAAAECDWIDENQTQLSKIACLDELGGYLTWRYGDRPQITLDAPSRPFDLGKRKTAATQVTRTTEPAENTPETGSTENPEGIPLEAASPAEPEATLPATAHPWLLSYRSKHLMDSFLASSELQLGAYGPSGVVFVPAQPDAPASPIGSLALAEKGMIRSPQRALEAALFAGRIRDWKGIEWTLESLGLQQGRQSKILRKDLQQWINGMFAMQLGEYAQAIMFFEAIENRNSFPVGYWMHQAYLVQGFNAWKSGDFQQAKDRFLQAESLDSQSIQAVFNCAIVHLLLHEKGILPTDEEGMKRIRKIAETPEDHYPSPELKAARQAAANIIEHGWRLPPPLLKSAEATVSTLDSAQLALLEYIKQNKSAL
jgi:tetratricopeptide (TPR) repeat protein